MRTLMISCLLGAGLLFIPQTLVGHKMSIVSVTAYSYSGGQYPHGVTASGKRVKEGMVALSRDLERNLNLKFGDRLLLHGLGVFEFQDRMASRWQLKADVFMHSNQKARSFGVKRHIVLVKLV